jgi:hypothetical protein
MKVNIDMRQPIHVRCECTHEADVVDLEAAIHWCFLEALRHGPGCNLDVAIDMTYHIETAHARALPSQPD